ncbi:MAG: DUF2723 domain-containing protein [Candidatus Omnitrophota bacterium]
MNPTLSWPATRRPLFLSLLFVFAFIVRFWLISKGPFHYDALDLAIQAQKTLETGALHYEHGSGYPLTVIFGAVFIGISRFFGVTDPVFSVNFMSVFFGACGVVAFFFLLEKLFSPVPGRPQEDAGCPSRVAAYGALLLSCFSPHVAISTFGKSLTLSIFLALSSAYFLLCFLRDGRRACLFWAAFFLGFCGAARLSDLLVLPALLILFFALGGLSVARLKEAVLFTGVALGTSLIYYVPMLMESGAGQFMDVLSKSEQASFLGIFSFILPKSLKWLMGSLRPEGAVIALAGFGLLWIHRRRKELAFLLAWFLILHFFYGNVSSSGTRYLVIAWLPLLAAQAYFLGNFRNRAVYATIAILLWLSAAGLYDNLAAMAFRHRYALQVDFARWVEKNTPPGSAVIAVDEALFLDHYTARDIVRRPVTCDDEKMEAFFAKDIEPAMAQGRRVFLVSTSFAYDRCRVFRKALKSRYELKTVGRHLNEDWHHTLLNKYLFWESLSELRKKEENHP